MPQPSPLLYPATVPPCGSPALTHRNAGTPGCLRAYSSSLSTRTYGGGAAARPRGTHKETAREANLLVRPAALAAHASSGVTRLHTDQQDHGGSNAPTRKGVRGLLGAEHRVEDRPCRVLISHEALPD